MTSKLPFKITFWGVLGIIFVAFGLYASYIRFFEGLGAATNLNDDFPWGLWIGFDVLCGVGLAAGGFTVSAVTHIFHIEKYKPLSRPAILTAFLGYVLVAVALIWDIGKPLTLWHPLIMWNPHSVMFEVAWCVTLYTTVLFLEFASFALEKFNWTKVLSILRKVMIPVFIAGIILSTLHQSSLGSVYLIVPTKMHPLWYSSFLPIFFFISAVAIGFAMVIFESYLSARGMNHTINKPLLADTAKLTMIILAIYGIARFLDLGMDGKFGYLFVPAQETYMFWLEIIIGLVVPIYIYSSEKMRNSRLWLFIGASFAVGGFMLNRLNVSITSLTRFQGGGYFPSIYEIGVTLMFVTIGVFVFKLISEHFPVFEHKIEDDEIHQSEQPALNK